MTQYLTISALDALRVTGQLARVEHSIVKITPVGAACNLCCRLLTAEQWAAPCPGLESTR